MKTPVSSLACQQSVFQRYDSEKHLPEFYPQDGGESQLASKLRHCYPVYNDSVRPIIWTSTRPIFTQFAEMVELRL